jgi:hypothetical protein
MLTPEKMCRQTMDILVKLAPATQTVHHRCEAGEEIRYRAKRGISLKDPRSEDIHRSSV